MSPPRDIPRELLAAAKCPNCDGSGSKPMPDNQGGWYLEQCQWFYERAEVLDAAPAAPAPQPCVECGKETMEITVCRVCGTEYATPEQSRRNDGSENDDLS